MHVKRTQVERSEATRGALIRAARDLFGERGYNDVGTEEIVAKAGVTRGALYHQFADKRDLFRAVLEDLEQDVVNRLGEQVVAKASGPGAALLAAMGAWLDACEEPEVQQIMLIDAPGVLGWQEWREMGQRHAIGETMALLEAAMDEGTIARQPVRPLAHVVVGALDEAVLYVAAAEDRAKARAEMTDVLQRLIIGLQ
ncbi:MAG: TetR/AcrR family transcriptional regulator [Actinobacteria bacterium]|nr:MAG: TetR/AcrR family transcriptional regulator [Actinomycetota bacterium]